MELPEGFKRLYVRGRIIEGPDCDDDEVIEALDLMKEMAEALELCHSALNSYTDIAEQNPEAIVCGYDALKKFGDWE